MTYFLKKIHYPKFLSSVPFLLIFFAALYILIDWLSYNGPATIPIILGTIAICLLFIKEKVFIYFITILLLLSDDFSKNIAAGDPIVNSIIGYPIYGKTILAYVLVFALLKIIIDALIREKKRFSLNIYDQIIIAIAILYLFSAIIGIPNLLAYPGEYLGHAGPIITIIIGYLLIRKNFCSKDELIKFFKIIIIVFTARLLATTLIFFSSKAIYYQINYSSVNHFILIPLYSWIGIMLWKNRKGNSSLIKKACISLIVILVLFNVIIYGQRTVIFNFVISLFLVFVLLLPMLPELVKTIALFGIIIVISIVILSTLTPQRFTYFKGKYVELLDWSLQPTPGRTTVAEREIQLINVFGKLVEKRSLLWGEGLGGYFDSKYCPLPPEAYGIGRTRGSFLPEQLKKDQFFKPHHPFILILLQMGILGFLIYLSLIFLIIFHLFKDFHKSPDANLRILFFTLVSGGFAILTLNPTLATNYLYGLMLALAANSHSNSLVKVKNKNL